MKNLPTPAAIEAEFGRLNRLRFAPEVESRFDLDGLAERKRVGRMTLLFGILIYNVFLFADWQVVPDMVGWLALLRLGVFTPIGLALYVWFASCASKTWHLDAASVGGTLLALVLPTAAAVFSQSPYVVIYQFGSMITITYFTLVQRVQFRFALVALTLSLAIQLGCVALRPEIDAASYLFIVNFYLAGAALLLVGSYTLERTERREFLERMRVEFLAGRIEQVARTDRLTGLWNRHHLAEVAPELAAGNPAAPIGALMIDIDHFKRFNDTQGHIAGDGCIRDVAGIVRATIEEAGGAPCHAFRFGGEEFLLLLPGRDLLQGAALGEAIRRRLRANAIPHPAMGEEALVTVSVGVAVCRAGSFSLDALVGAADAALYQAKRGGRDRLVMAA